MGKKEEWIFMGMKQFMGKYPTLSPMPLPYPTLPAGIGLFMGKYPTLSPLPLPYPTLPAGISLFMGKCPTLSPLGPTLPYPKHGDSSCPWRQFWPPAGIRRFVGREDTQSPLPLTHGDSSSSWRQFIAQSRGWSALWASALPCRLCPLTMETVSREEAHSSMWFHTLSYAIEFHRTFFNRDSSTGISTFIHVIPYTFICNRIPSNTLQ